MPPPPPPAALDGVIIRLDGEPALHVPLYLTEGRERAIAEVQFPVFDGEEASKWILAGTACFLGPVE